MTQPLVLIADNDRAVSSLLVEVTRRQGLEVRAAYDGEEAARILAGARVDAFVCDLDMPRMGGLEVLEALAAAGSAPPTVVVSGFLGGEVEARLQALPFVRAVLKKPFDLLAFGERVRELAVARAPSAAPSAGAEAGEQGATEGLSEAD